MSPSYTTEASSTMLSIGVTYPFSWGNWYDRLTPEGSKGIVWFTDSALGSKDTAAEVFAKSSEFVGAYGLIIYTMELQTEIMILLNSAKVRLSTRH